MCSRFGALLQSQPPLTLVLELACEHKSSANLRQCQLSEMLVMLLQSQAQDRTMVRDLLQTASTPSGSGGTEPQLTLAKKGSQDDPEAFLVLFKETLGCGVGPRRRGWPDCYHSCQGRSNWQPSSYPLQPAGIQTI